MNITGRLGLIGRVNQSGLVKACLADVGLITQIIGILRNLT